MKILVGKETVESQAADLLYDESRFSDGVPERVYFPESETDIIKIINEAKATGHAITIIGGQTGITGGSVPVNDCYAVCISSMKRIHKAYIDKGQTVLSCDPGITLENLSRCLQDPLYSNEQFPGKELLNGSLFYPPDPTEMTAQLGGTVATNASGARSFFYGPTRNHIYSVRVVLANGETATIKRGELFEKDDFFTFSTDQGNTLTIPRPSYTSPKIKNASGYYSKSQMDLIDLLIGSEGTLAFFVRIDIKLQKKPELFAGLSFFPSRKEAFDFADFLRSEKHVAAIEYFDKSTLAFLETNRKLLSFELPGINPDRMYALYWEFINNAPLDFESILDKWEEILVQCGSSFELTWSGADLKDAEKLKAFRHAIPELVNSTIAKYKQTCPSVRKIGTDAALPGGKFREIFSKSVDCIESANLQYAAFGHLGDFHIHINMLPKNETELDAALSAYKSIMILSLGCEGTVSAEHGIGKIKREYLAMMYGCIGIEEMKTVKRAFDPTGLLNPGNLF